MASIKDNEGNQYLSFYIKDEMFAINVSCVKEIIQYTQITRVPMMQSFVAGITNIRGSVIPVIDLSDRLGLGRSPIDKKTCVITVGVMDGSDEMEIGIVIDVVEQVYEVTSAHIMDSPEFGTRVRKDFIQMMARIDDKFMTMLAVDSILSIHELSRVIPKKVI